MRLKFSLVQGPVEYVSVDWNKVRSGCRVDHVNRIETSVRVLVLTAMCESVSMTSYLSGGREDIRK